MRLARVQADEPGADSAIAALAAGAQLDLLQLDYPPTPGASSAAFLDHFRKLHKHLFLEPTLRLITNAGDGAVRTCIEALGKYLCEHGDEGMPVTAIRGDNLLPRVTGDAQPGIELIDETTGQPLDEHQERLLAAQVELGAGPFVTAWDEGSRVVVAGCYDPTAPFIAAAKSELAVPWDDYDALARAALAASATSTLKCVAEIADSLALDFGRPAPAEPSPPLQGPRKQADVVCELDFLTFTASGQYVAVAGAVGCPPSGLWRVRLTYASDDMVDSARPPRVRWALVPRDAVPVSVDTRPAREWF